MRDCGGAGLRPGQIGLAELVEEERPATAQWREGADFGGAEDLARLAGAGAAEERAVPGWAVVAWRAMKELARAEWTGEAPGGGSWGRQPAWKVELWEAYWQGLGSRHGKVGEGAGRYPGS